jgi:uncharacterized protein YkwD
VLVGLAAVLAVCHATGSAGAANPLTAARFSEASTPSVALRRGARACDAGESWGVRRDDLAHAVARIVNEYRIRIGVRPLRLLPSLTRSATWKAQHMAHFHYFGHSDPAPPVSRSVPQRLAACGFGSAGSENIAYGYGTALAVVRAWLRSPGHRRNIELAGWKYMGVGAAKSRRGDTFWAQNFG